MKISQIVLLAFLNLLLVQSLNAQTTAVGGCNAVKLTSVISYPTNLIIAGGWSCQACDGECFDFLATSPPQYAQTRNWLEKKQTNGNWSVVQGGSFGIHGDNITFKVSEHGTYRIRSQRPRPLVTGSCPSGRVVYNVLGQFVGHRGSWASFPTDYSWSNEVIVGATVQSDITWNFIDANGNNLFSPEEPIRMNTTGTKNYEGWWLSISENGGQNRYWSNNWTMGQIPGNILDLTGYSPFSGGFQQVPTSYTVQFAISAGCNTSWTNLSRNFAICPSGWGCRLAGRVAGGEGIILHPNPASNIFHLQNLDIGPTNQQRILVQDMSGRTLKSFDQISRSEFDISDLNNGLYLVSVWEGAHRTFITKLSVVR